MTIVLTYTGLEIDKNVLGVGSFNWSLTNDGVIRVVRCKSNKHLLLSESNGTFFTGQNVTTLSVTDNVTTVEDVNYTGNKPNGFLSG